MAIIAFDTDDCLIIPPEGSGRTDGRDIPNYDIINLYRWYQKEGHHMICWSGGGKDYAQMWADKLGLNPDEVLAKCPMKDYVDICYDDCLVDLAKVNIKVARYNNGKKRMVPSFRDAEEQLIKDNHNV